MATDENISQPIGIPAAVEIPSWQYHQIIKSLDDYLRSEFEKEENKLREQIIELGGDIRSYQKEGDYLRHENKKLVERIQFLEAQIGRICIQKGIIQ